MEEVVSDSALIQTCNKIDIQNLLLSKITEQSSKNIKWSSIKELIKLGLASYVFSIGDIIDVCCVEEASGSISEVSATISVDKSIFASTSEAYEFQSPLKFTYDSANNSWKDRQNNPVTLSNYGISVSASSTIPNNSVLSVSWRSSYRKFQVVGFNQATSKMNYKYSMTLQLYEVTDGYNDLENTYSTIPFSGYPEVSLVINSGSIDPSLVNSSSSKTYYKFSIKLPDSSISTYYIDGSDFNAGDKDMTNKHNRLILDIPRLKARSVNYSRQISEEFDIYTSYQIQEEIGYSATDLSEGLIIADEVILNHNINENCQVSWNRVDRWLGSSCYDTSAIRQWINSSSSASSSYSSWWTPVGDFQFLPYPDSVLFSLTNEGLKCKGFINGLDAQFVDIVGKTLFTIFDGIHFRELEDKFYLPSVSEIRGLYTQEGAAYNFYSQYTSMESNESDECRIRYNTSPQYYYTRSGKHEYSGYQSMRNCFIVGKTGDIINKQDVFDDYIYVCPLCTIYG